MHPLTRTTVYVQTYVIEARSPGSALAHAAPAVALATVETACRVTLGVFGAAFWCLGLLCAALADPLRVAGAAAVSIAKGGSDGIQSVDE